MQNRFKSKVFWIGIISIVMLVMSNYGLYDLIGMTETTFGKLSEMILNAVFFTTASIGIANNPTDKENF